MLGSEGKPITEPTFTGFVDSTYDALILFEACLRGVCPKISRRLQEKERQLIKSGSVFVFNEKESGIKRWTDGLLWSPSRILGNFLIYRELDSREPSGRGTGLSAQDVSPRTGSARDRCLTNSTYRFKNNGLVKKTVSLADMHIICYYRVNDVVDGRFRHPSSLPELVSLDISPYLLTHQNFRVPVKIEIGPDQQPRFAGETDDNSNSTASSSSMAIAAGTFDPASSSRKRSPTMGHQLSLDTTGLQDYSTHGRSIQKAGGSMAAFAPQPAGALARPPNVRSYSTNPTSMAAKQRFEPYPTRPATMWTAPTSPVSSAESMPSTAPYPEPWVTMQHSQQRGGLWNGPNYYVPQVHATGQNDPRLGQYAPYEQNWGARRPQSQQGQNWHPVDLSAFGNDSALGQDRSISAPSSSSSDSTDLPVGPSLPGSDFGLPDPSHETSLAPAASSSFYPICPPPEDQQELLARPVPHQSPSRAMSHELSGRFQQLDTQSDYSAPPSPFGTSRRSSAASAYAPQQQQQSAYYQPTAISAADNNSLALSLHPSGIPAQFPTQPYGRYPSSLQQQSQMRQTSGTDTDGQNGALPYEMPLRSTGMVEPASQRGLAMPLPSHASQLPPCYSSGQFYSSAWPAFPQDSKEPGKMSMLPAMSTQSPWPLVQEHLQ